MPLTKPRYAPPPLPSFDDPDTEVVEVTNPGVGIGLRLPGVCPSRGLRDEVTVSRIRVYRAHLEHCEACQQDRAEYLLWVRTRLETNLRNWRAMPDD